MSSENPLRMDSDIDPRVDRAIRQAVAVEPFARLLDIRLDRLSAGHSVVSMTYRPEIMDNIYGRAHGGALFALIDEAFETASQTEGTIAVALNVNVTYVASPTAGTRLTAEARQASRTRKTAGYEIRVTDDRDRLIASCQALAYRTGRAIPFLEPECPTSASPGPAGEPAGLPPPAMAAGDDPPTTTP